jgi:microcystin-dependent protein
MDGLIGEVRAFAFGYNPEYWIPCDGRQLNVQQYPALFSILGARFGGNGSSTFNVPNLSCFAVMGAGQGQTPPLSNRNFSATTGSAAVALTNNQLPDHDHNVNGYVGIAAEANYSNTPVMGTSYLSNFFSKDSAGAKTNLSGYVDPQTNPVTLSPDSLSPIGTPSSSGVAHENRQPFTVLNYCICYQGEYPTQP